MRGIVVAVASRADHSFSKDLQPSIRLVAGEGVEGDAHRGITVKHRSRVARDPTKPNLRQVHLIHAELFDELRAAGYEIAPGDLGENVTTRGLALLGLSTGTVLEVGEVRLEVTGLRNPCQQINKFKTGLMQAVLDTDAAGELVRKAGIMAVVLSGGEIRAGDAIRAVPPIEPFRPLLPV
jgi:MOSC domain-containing protein YiiM